MLRVFNDTAGGDQVAEEGSIAIYLEPWHPDIFEFLDLRKTTVKRNESKRLVLRSMDS